MILNAPQLYARLFNKDGSVSSITVAPPPKEEGFLEKTGASIDLHLGRWFRTMRQSNVQVLRIGDDVPAGRITKEHFVAFDGEFILHPGKFVLGITLEWLTIPGDLAGYVTGKSALGRRGLIIETAAGIQPGFAGCLTLELANVGEIPISLRPGTQICQIFLHKASSDHSGAASQF